MVKVGDPQGFFVRSIGDMAPEPEWKLRDDVIRGCASVTAPADSLVDTPPVTGIRIESPAAPGSRQRRGDRGFRVECPVIGSLPQFIQGAVVSVTERDLQMGDVPGDGG